MNANAATIPASTYEDGHGGTVIIEPKDVLTYAGVKTAQLRAITMLLTEAALGNLELDKSELQEFQLMANEYARNVERLVGIAASHEHARKNGEQTASKKGGE